jgi:hypothetical protein
MPQVKFEYNLEKDVWNVLRVINTPPTFDPDNLKRPLGKLPEELTQGVKKENDPLKQGRIVNNFLEAALANKHDLIKQRIDQFSKEWVKINNEYFERLKRILNIKIPPETLCVGYLTSAGSCPFNAKERYFMVRIDDEKIDTVAAHEMLHIEFIRNFGLYCRDVLKLSPEDFGAFQEASTFLLNAGMADILSRPDYGYKEHQELRSKLSAEWTKNKDINSLLNYYKGLIKT